jgi:hypothetical protein
MKSLEASMALRNKCGEVEKHILKVLWSKWSFGKFGSMKNVFECLLLRTQQTTSVYFTLVGKIDAFHD